MTLTGVDVVHESFFFMVKASTTRSLACGTVGEGTADCLHVCVCFGRISSGVPVGFCHAPDWGIAALVLRTP